jgi:hypothetical protein
LRIILEAEAEEELIFIVEIDVQPSIEGVGVLEALW